MARVIVDVMLKPEIHDPQGDAVLSASHRLGFGNVIGVRQGKRFEVELDGPADDKALAAIRELAGELLANSVIEEFTVRLARLAPDDQEPVILSGAALAYLPGGDPRTPAARPMAKNIIARAITSPPRWKCFDL